MKKINIYENPELKEVTGETLRPGGFALTEIALGFCNIKKEQKILDLGCGTGASIEYLYNHYGIVGTGIDPSEKLLKFAKEKNIEADFLWGKGEELPFEDHQFDCVLAECTLSLMSDLKKTQEEIKRVLKPKGYLIITDVYARNSKYLKELKPYHLNSCIRGLHDLALLQENLTNLGYSISLIEDHSELLKALMVKIIFKYGSMDMFWSKTGNKDEFCNVSEFQEVLKACKPGYFMIIARKG